MLLKNGKNNCRQREFIIDVGQVLAFYIIIISVHLTGTGDRFATFELKNGVAIKAGYAGFGEPDPNARDTEVYETFLSGDLLGNDGTDFANNYENSYHVVTGSGTNDTAVLDGFIITAGNANGSKPYDIVITDTPGDKSEKLKRSDMGFKKGFCAFARKSHYEHGI